MNPFYCYIFSFALALLAYQLPWSSAYSGLTVPLLIFLLTTLMGAGAAAYYWKNKLKGWVEPAMPADKKPLAVTAFIYILWLADFAYEGGVPLFKILFGLPYNYRTFGVPSLHVFTVTFSSFYTLYLFHRYLRQRQTLLLLLYVVNLSAAVLIYSRAMLGFNLMGSFFIFWFCSLRIPKRFLAFTPLIILLLLYVFGVLGTLRVSREYGTPYDNRHFLAIGQATQSFKTSGVPGEFFWSYVYLTSPIANLQENVNVSKKDTLALKKVVQLVTNEFMFDFISKRTNRVLGLTPAIEGRISGPFNVSTVYSQSFSLLHWYGVAAMAFFILVLPFLYLRLLQPTSPYFLTGLAILCTMYFFMVYDNTIRFTGLGLQLVYPVIAGWLQKRSLPPKKSVL